MRKLLVSQFVFVVLRISFQQADDRLYDVCLVIKYIKQLSTRQLIVFQMVSVLFIEKQLAAQAIIQNFWLWLSSRGIGLDVRDQNAAVHIQTAKIHSLDGLLSAQIPEPSDTSR